MCMSDKLQFVGQEKKIYYIDHYSGIMSTVSMDVDKSTICFSPTIQLCGPSEDRKMQKKKKKRVFGQQSRFFS